MAYDEGMAERIRAVLDGARGVTEKRMFGGIAFLLDGKMFVGLATEDLMVRVGAEAHADALARPHVRPMDFTGRPMVGYVYVAPDGIDDDEALAAWVRQAMAFAASLPSKKQPPSARASKGKPKPEAPRPPSPKRTVRPVSKRKVRPVSKRKVTPVSKRKRR